MLLFKLCRTCGTWISEPCGLQQDVVKLSFLLHQVLDGFETVVPEELRNGHYY